MHFVTGATSGIGAAIADALFMRDEELMLLVRSEETALRLRGRYPGAKTLTADMSDLHALERELSKPSLPKALSSLIHAAGVLNTGSIANTKVHEWQEHLSVNLVAPAIITAACLAPIRNGNGTVVFVNSGAGLSAHAMYGAYSASKFGLRALADSLRLEEEAEGVRVTTIYPGRTATRMQAKAHQQEGKVYDPSVWIKPESVASTVLHVLELGRDAVLPDVPIRPAHS